MRTPVLSAAAVLTLLVCAPARALPLTADFSYTLDQDGGRALDADFSIAPTERLTLHAGAGRSRGGGQSADLGGTLLGAGVSWHGDRLGAAVSWDAFDDRSNYHSATLGARAWVTAGDFEWALLARRRELAVDVTLALPLRTVRREVAFGGSGAGLQLTVARPAFNAYVMALGYDYDRDFDDFIDLIHSPQLELRPRIEALVGSVVLQTQGAVDRQAGAGLEFGAGRQSVAIDVAYVHDAVLDSDSRSVAVSFRRAQNAHFDWGLSAGLVTSDAFGNVGFLGVEVGLAN